MLVTLKTLQQQTFKIEVDPEDTVLRLKEKIAKEKGEEYAIANQKLIYAGKILDDAQKINLYKIEEKNFVVIMVTQPKIITPIQPTTAVSTATATAVTTSMTPVQPISTQVDTPIAAPATNVETPENALVTGETFEKAVREIVEMGFERDSVLQAMAASYNNPDRAVEYLLSGTLPDEGLGRPESQPAGGQHGVPVTNTITSADDPLAYLMTQPQFQQMRTLIQSNPDLLPTILQQISQSNPRLMQMITENQDRFVQMLNDPLPPGGGGGAPTVGGVGSGGVLESADQQHQQPQQQQQGESNYIQVTPEERQAIERLKQLGFPETMCLQAYFACEKNEDLAANFLLSQDYDDFYDPS